MTNKFFKISMVAMVATAFIALPTLNGCMLEENTGDNAPRAAAQRAQKYGLSPAASEALLPKDMIAPPEEIIEENSYPVEFPTGWLIAPTDGIEAGEPVKLLYLPDASVSAHRNGEPISDEDLAELQESWPVACEDDAIVQYGENIAAIDENLLLVNLPDILPQAEYDIVYSYAATSNSGGEPLPGVTGERLEGYQDGEQPSAYWGDDRFVAPCAYQTALKAFAASDELVEAGYRLLVYDAYRPMAAQMQLYWAIQDAYASNPTVAANLGGWSIDWFVADGSSGHNFGTDLDVGVCSLDGNPIEMPSSFDAFDASGLLTDVPVEPSDINPSLYRYDIASNDACMALHYAFVDAGFSELASEWWHFGDESTEYAIRAIVGNGGLNFEAHL